MHRKYKVYNHPDLQSGKNLSTDSTQSTEKEVL